MATIIDLARTAGGAIEKVDPGFEGSAQEFRCLFGSQKFKRWLQTDLPAMTSALGLEIAPAEQLFDLVQLYCSDEPLTYGDHFKPLRCRGQGVWEFRTADLRVFGWFPLRDHFIAVAANDATFIKDHDLYPGYIGEVVRFRDHLNLDEPKYIQSEDPRDVVSNYNFG